MANSNEAQTTKSSPKTANTPPQQDKITVKNPTINAPKSSIHWWSTLTTIIAVIALVFAVYASYSSIQLRQNLNNVVDNLKQQQSNINTRLTTTTEATETIKRLQATLQNHVQDLGKNLQSAMQQQLYQKQDWLLLKARYYLELAQINANWSDEQQATITLLQQADTLLQVLPQQHLFAVRQAIAKEIAQLQALPKIDITGLLSQLDAAQDALTDLPIKQPINSTQTRSDKNTGNTSSSSWHQRLRDSMNVLEKLVVIRRNDKDIQPLLSPLHQTLLRDSIRLNLQEAQWAILQKNPKVYQLSLNQALKGIKQAFDERAASTEALIKQLQSLQQEKFTATKPVIEESLSLLNQQIESKNSKTTDTSETTDGGKTQ